jgi:hypothetical protein
MFSPEEEAANGDGWEVEMASDVTEECSKYGQVVHCHVDKASMVGANGQGWVCILYLYCVHAHFAMLTSPGQASHQL